VKGRTSEAPSNQPQLERPGKQRKGRNYHKDRSRRGTSVCDRKHDSTSDGYGDRYQQRAPPPDLLAIPIQRHEQVVLRETNAILGAHDV
jgi:hypothetical protein